MKQFPIPERRQFFVGWVAAFVLAATLFPTQADAQAKIRIAIWDFENNAEQRWWFYNDLGPAARNFIDTAFFEDPALSAQFSVIEREKLEMVLKEQGLATSGALDQQTAAKVGKVLLNDVVACGTQTTGGKKQDCLDLVTLSYRGKVEFFK